jgi:hypothetical protein
MVNNSHSLVGFVFNCVHFLAINTIKLIVWANGWDSSGLWCHNCRKRTHYKLKLTSCKGLIQHTLSLWVMEYDILCPHTAYFSCSLRDWWEFCSVMMAYMIVTGMVAESFQEWEMKWWIFISHIFKKIVLYWIQLFTTVTTFWPIFIGLTLMCKWLPSDQYSLDCHSDVHIFYVFNDWHWYVI